jgi:hypothetical protein
LRRTLSYNSWALACFGLRASTSAMAIRCGVSRCPERWIADIT